MITNLYFLQRADGLVKIGITRNVTARLTALSRVHGPLVVLKVVAGGRKQESELHNRLSQFKQFGEWFSPVAETMLAVETAADTAPVPDLPRGDEADQAVERPFVERAERYVLSCLTARRQRLGAAPVKERLHDLAATHGMTHSFLDRIHAGRAKTITAGMLERLKVAAVEEMEATIAHLRKELEDEEMAG